MIVACCTGYHTESPDLRRLCCLHRAVNYHGGVSALYGSLHPDPNSIGFHTSKVVSGKPSLLNNGIRTVEHTYMDLFRFLILLLDMNELFLSSILLCSYLLV